MTTPKRYWDSDLIISWILEETERVEKCEGVVAQAKSGNLTVVVSTLSLVEVLVYRPDKKISRDKITVVQDFFKQPFIEIVQLTTQIAEESREFVWDHGIGYKDAIHVATAIHRDIPRMDSFDDDLIKRARALANSHGLTIDYPDVPYAPTLEDELARQEREGA